MSSGPRGTADDRRSSPGGGPLEALPTQPPADYDAAPISPRDRSNAGILATLLFLGVAAMGSTAVIAAANAEWLEAAKALLWGSCTVWPALLVWRSRRRHVDLVTGEDLQIAAVESRAMLEALERYDRVHEEGRAVAGAKAGGESAPG